MTHSILVVDDEANLRKVIQGLLEQEGYRVVQAKDGIEALAILKQEKIHTIISDLKMPNLDGLGLLEAVSKQFPDIPVIILTAYQTVETAISALKLGALDYLSKPFDKREILPIVQKAIAHYEQRSKGPSDQEIHSDLITHSPLMKNIMSMIQKIADTPSTVLISGESGTGKELVAKTLHVGSRRNKHPFIAINCSAIPATLIESELFGYEKGAFTGAVGSKPGRFELADGGTLFLDEIAEIPLELQAKLLRVLQENEIERVGGIQTKKIDIRLIVATNKDLQQEIQKGTFREDLFYRLNVVPITLPPLRERLEDFPYLIDFFIKKYNKKLEKNIQGIEEEVLNAFKHYAWPGNIRQLENVIERMVLLSEKNTLSQEMLPTDIGQVPSISIPMIGPQDFNQGGSFKNIVKETTQHIEINLIKKALAKTHGNVTQAAKSLGISRKSLQNKMKEYNLRNK